MRHRSPKLVFSAGLLALILLSGLLAPLIAPYDPNAIDMSVKLQGFSPAHPLGTDALGRDMLSRALYGGRTSILLALAATALSMAFGLLLGILGGYFGGPLDMAITALANIFQGLPGTCLMVAIAGILGPGIPNLLLALFVTSWAGFSRIVRTETLRIREEPYIEGLRSLGAGSGRLLWRHILPNMMTNIIVLFTTRVGRCVLSIASLSYLGLGIRPPAPDWSVMISDARLDYRSAPHLIIVPGLCIFLLLFALNLLGDALRDHFDVRSREVKEL